MPTITQILKSKTIMANVLTLVLVIAVEIGKHLGYTVNSDAIRTVLTPENVAVIGAVVNVVLRAVTKVPLKEK